MRIISVNLVRGAIELVRPTAEKILDTEGTTWGPKWVEGRVKAPGLEEIGTFDFGTTSRAWDPAWGEEKYFGEIAEKKLYVADREGVNTSIVVTTRPWNLKEGEYLYDGGATRNGITVAVSGAESKTDEAIAEMVISAIVMLASLETKERLEKGQEEI
jgi:hypothetical protein